jgi:site-specific recombinase XerD
MQENRVELAVLRGKTGPEALALWTQAFAGGDEDVARQYLAVIARFVGDGAGAGDESASYMGSYAPGTRRAYAFALTEFFEWLASKYGRVVTPPQVTKKDAEDYVQWLTSRPYSLEGERLRDGDQRERLALYEIVRDLGSADLTSIAGRAPAWLIAAHPAHSDRSAIDRTWLHHELGRMVLHDMLVRSPTMKELRQENPHLGVYVFHVMVTMNGKQQEIALPDVFSYSLPVPRAVGRSTVAQRMAALSAFWRALTIGENTGAGALVRYNIFDDIARRVRRGLAADNKAARARRGRLTPQLVERLLRAADGPTLTEKRDAAMLWFLVLTGTRITETMRIRRGIPSGSETNRWPAWFDNRANPPVIELTRKGGFRQRLPYPPYALKALYAFQADLERYAALDGLQNEDPNAPFYLPPTAAAWRYRSLIESDAPLFPPIRFWGNNSPSNYEEFKPNARPRPDYRRPMTRHGVDVALKRIAKKAGFTDEETALVHGHAFRHFAATAMVKQGKPLREVQHILGHGSVTTTEGYVEAETSHEALSGQNEILDYIAGGAVREPPAPPEPTAPREPPPAPRQVIDTYAVPARDRPERPRKPVEPAQAPRITPEAVVAQEGRLVEIAPKGVQPPGGVEIRGDVSPPSPIQAYAGHAPPKLGPQSEEQRLAQQEPIQFSIVNVRKSSDPSDLVNLAGTDPVKKGDAVVVTATGRKGQVTSVLRKVRGETAQRVVVRIGSRDETLLATELKRDLVQQNPWLRDHYDPWPVNYGIGEGSLLPWFATGSASANGEVKVDLRDGRTVYVPPLPVLATPQTEARYAPLLWKALDEMRSRWLRASPTKALGLDRWWGTFLTILRQLTTATGGKYRWVPFDANATLGKDIRAHDEEYLVTWLEINAERFTTTVRAFEEVARLRGRAEAAPEEWEAFQRAWRDAAVMGASPAEELPDWFVLDDPVHDIYEKDREEWAWFVKWIGAVTGQRVTADRTDTLDSDAQFARSERTARIEQSRGLLQLYYETVSEVRESTGEEREAQRASLKAITEQLAEFGVPDPKKMLKAGKLQKKQSRDASIEQLLAVAFPEADVSEVDPNVLKSRLFDADTFRIDTSKRTISHTPEFRKTFAERYDGRDSECVMRRAARGMWEHVKRHGIPLERGAQRSSEYSLLYSVMLSYAAWIFPCPEEIERRLAKQFADGAEARMVWLKGVRQASQRISRSTEDMDTAALVAVAQEEGLDRKSALEVVEEVLIASTVQAGEAVPAPETTARAAERAVRDGTVISAGPGGVVIRRRKPMRGAEKRKVHEDDPGFSREEILEELQVYGGSTEDEDLAENPRYMTFTAFVTGYEYIANAEQALPSALRMMTAMTLRF